MEPREQKAIEIAAKAKLTRKGNTWIVPSQSGPKKYTVDPNPQAPNCDCPDFEARKLPCNLFGGGNGGKRARAGRFGGRVDG